MSPTECVYCKRSIRTASYRCENANHPRRIEMMLALVLLVVLLIAAAI